VADPDVLGTREALCQELDEIERRRNRRSGTPRIVHDDFESREQRARRLQLSALCLSGGGIRSAAFCLGVLQALARKGLVRQFDYLSTVSGGGFIGGWLQVLIHEAGGVGAAEEAIAQPRPGVLRRLRAYTNYLTPQTGPLSADTWTGIVLYLRNLLINWAVFAPLFLLITLVPIFYRTAISASSDLVWINLALLTCAALSLLVAVVGACSLLPSHREPRSLTDPSPSYASSRGINWGIVYPAFAWALLVPWLLDLADKRLIRERQALWLAHHTYWIVPALYLLLMTLGFALAWSYQSYRGNRGAQLFRGNFGRWICASVGSALLTWLMLIVAGSILPLDQSAALGDLLYGWGPSPIPASIHVDTATALTVFAPLALTVVHVLQTSLYVALRRETNLADLDREWLGRVNAMILRLAAGWTVFALYCLILPLLVTFVQRTDVNGIDHDSWSAGFISLMGAVTMLAGGIAAWLGKIWKSVEEIVEQASLLDRVRAHLPVAIGVLFAGSLLVVFGGVVNFVLAQLQVIVANAWQGWEKDQPIWLPLVLQFLVGAILLIGVVTFQQVNVNRFSMHGVYRNRLTRAFLGSARNRREQDPFTGFDPRDNPPLSSLLQPGNSLFPVINTTLNITAGCNTAWAERKAASFTATPLACGSAALRHPSQTAGDVDPGGAFVPTTRYAGLETLRAPTKPPEMGPGLGNALTVSGAAVSPSWGYHSSRLTAFIMTLFNVRLGVWLPNPAKATADELRLARPRNSLRALINEMLGKTTDDAQAIYLSDGGHFENLGLYEMFRRRCSAILVVDAGADEACSLFDLGNAIRKAEIDLGISVMMVEPMRLYARKRIDPETELTANARGFAFGEIDYGDGHKGELLYIKPSFLARIPIDVRSYGSEHESFPHESTLDQWFSESQFESYRILGQFQMAGLLRAVGDGDLAQVFAAGRIQAEEREAPTEIAGGDALLSVVVGRIGQAREEGRGAAAE
jgi:hypothetical protein